MKITTCLLVAWMFSSQCCAFPTFESMLKNLWFKGGDDTMSSMDSESESSRSERVKRQSVAADSSSKHYEVLTTG